MKHTGIYTLTELLKLEMEATPLIDKLLWARDNVFVVGHEKAGKSILGMQLGCALSSGQPLFGEYHVHGKHRVLYVQAEGKLLETKERFTNMVKVNDADTETLWLAYYPAIALDTPDGFKTFCEDIKAKEINPDVIILDPLYHCMGGKLTDEYDARRMTINLRHLSELYDATLIVLHHTHKPIRTKEGNVIDEGDDSIFGSFVWKAWADHTLLLKRKEGKMRVLSCNTQRSGKVLEYEELLLIDDPYLSFDRKEESLRPYDLVVRRVVEEFAERGGTRDEIAATAAKSLSAVEKSLRKLIKMGEIVKDNNKRPVHYWSRMHAPQSVGENAPQQKTEEPSGQDLHTD